MLANGGQPIAEGERRVFENPAPRLKGPDKPVVSYLFSRFIEMMDEC